MYSCNPKTERNKEIYNLRAKGYKLQEIANVYGISRERVREIVGNTGWVYSWKTLVSQHPSAFDIRHIPTEMFWERVNIKTKDECWEWLGSKRGPQGYGGYTIHKNTFYAHRLSWIYIYGDIPKGLYVCHKCDNPICVNPYHLFLGTAKDNAQDRENKCRGRFSKQLKPIVNKLLE
jgi:hypothetical protein